MGKPCSLYLAAALALPGLTACGLSGGSVPIGGGGRAVIGRVNLPGLQASAGLNVKILSLPSLQVIGTATTGPGGTFAAVLAPTDQDIEIMAASPAGVMGKTVVGQAALAAHPEQPLDIGAIDPQSTVVAAAVEIETSHDPASTGEIVSTQADPLSAEVASQNAPALQQQQWVSDPSFLQSTARTTIIRTASRELATFAASRSASVASAALIGLKESLAVQQPPVGAAPVAPHPITTSAPQPPDLVTPQLNGVRFTTAMVASALQSAGVSQATPEAVQAASSTIRQATPAFTALGPGISPFEALAIGGSPQSQGGFELGPDILNSYLDRLLNPLPAQLGS